MTESERPDEHLETAGAATAHAPTPDTTPPTAPTAPTSGTGAGIPPPPVGPSPRPHDLLAPSPPREPTPLAPAWVAAGVAAGVAADLALRRPPFTNVAGAILVAVLAVGLVLSGYLTGRTSRLLATGAVFFGIFLAVRTQPILLAFDLLAATLLLVLAAVHGRDRSLWDLRPLRLGADGIVVIVESIEGLFHVPAEAAARVRVARERAADRDDDRTWAALRGLAITAPVVLVLGLLLASADVVFQSFFDGFGRLDVPSAIGHAVLFGFGAYAMVVLLRLAHLQGASSAPRSERSLGAVETGVLLVSVTALFAAFAVAQLLTVLGGADSALARAGLDPKQFARQGFFQLLWVAGLTLGLLMVVHVLTDEQVPARRINRLLSPVTVGLTLLIVGVAFTRILYYIDEGGLTPLRLYSSVFALWVGVAFVITAIRIQGVRPTRAWLLPVLMVSGLVTLAGLNLVDIEAVIASDNLARTDDALYWHVEAGQFSGAGEAVLADRLDELDPELAARIETRLCEVHEARRPSAGWLDANLGQRRGQDALDRLCE
jgi:hypothetical protein